MRLASPLQEFSLEGMHNFANGIEGDYMIINGLPYLRMVAQPRMYPTKHASNSMIQSIYHITVFIYIDA